jgi:phage shock protein C
MKKLTRTDKSDSMVFGVCGGLAKHFEMDTTIVRIIVALLTVFSFGGLLLAYIIMAIIMPKEI